MSNHYIVYISFKFYLFQYTVQLNYTIILQLDMCCGAVNQVCNCSGTVTTVFCWTFCTMLLMVFSYTSLYILRRLDSSVRLIIIFCKQSRKFHVQQFECIVWWCTRYENSKDNISLNKDHTHFFQHYKMVGVLRKKNLNSLPIAVVLLTPKLSTKA